MPLLQVRDCPPDLYDQISLIADNDRRSIAQQTVVLLREAVGLTEPSKSRRGRAVADALRFAQSVPAGHLDSTDLIREDRER